jgi:1,2-diacylglycerol 3-alpha-glucosyltransferase
MRLAVFWSEILHYHTARIAALYQLGEARGCTIYPFALRPGSPDLPLMGYHNLLGSKITLLSQDPIVTGPNSELSQRQVAGFLNKHSPDVVAIAGYSDPVALTALQWCRQHRRGAVLMSESQASDYVRSPIRERMKRCLVGCFDSALVGGSPHVAYAQALGMPTERIFKGYDAVDNDFWAGWTLKVRSEPEAWRKKLGLPDRFFLTASRLVSKKNVAGLLRAYALYAQQTQTLVWPLLVVGDGPLKGQLQDLAGKLNLENRVRFTGYLSATDMAPVYALASVFILASEYSEQWGLVVNEAMAAGTPVLVSQICGSAADLVVDGETGFKFDPKDENALAGLLQQCALGAFDLTQMGLAAQDRVARFHPSVFADSLLRAADVASKNAYVRRFDLVAQAYITVTRRFLSMMMARVE